MEIKALNNLVHMSGIPLRHAIERQLTRTMRHRLSQFPEQELGQDWMEAVITVGKKEQAFEAEEKLLKQHRTEGPLKKTERERVKEEASKWKAVKTITNTPSTKKEAKKGPKDRDNLTKAEKEEKEKLLKKISPEL